MRNPMIPLPVGAWFVFLITVPMSTFKPWAWVVWVPWLLISTAAPFVWWWRNRNTNAC